MTAQTLMMLPQQGELDVVMESQENDGVTASAVLDHSRQYRYLLTRIWDPSRPLAVWLMLNPSTADAMQDDRTVGRCRSFAREWGRGGIAVVNLFALRSTDPAVLRTHKDPVGPYNAAFVRQAVRQSDLVVAAWGGPGVLGDRGPAMTKALRADGVRLKTLGVISSGQPKHPLYVRGGTPLVDYLSET